MPKKKKKVKKQDSYVIENVTNDQTINLAFDTIKLGKQALVFANTKRSAEKTAEDISKKIKLEDKDEVEKLNALSDKILKSLSRPTKQCERLARCMRKGSVFHHAGLAAGQRRLIETSFREGSIKIIACTPTLAMGIDLPAFRTIHKSLRRFTHRGMDWIPVLEYLQMAGRAGRPKFDDFGESIAVASTGPEQEAIEERYINGEPEDIYSKLAVESVLRVYILSMVASNLCNTKQGLLDFFEKTFWAHQFRDMNKIERIIDKILKLLDDWEFIGFRNSEKNNDFVSADDMNKDNRISATILGKRVSELYIDPLTANFLITCIRRASSLALVPFSFLQAVCHTLEMRPLLNVRQKDMEKIDEMIVSYDSNLLEKEPSLFEPDHDDYIASIKTALFMQEWIDENDEEYLLENYNIRPGEIRVKLDLGDWLLYAMEEFARILHFQKIIREIKKARLRLKYGVKEELFPLLRLKNIGRVRARILFRNKIRTLTEIKKADYLKLSQLLGKNIARSIKEQAGQDMDKLAVKKNKRKGQISIGDWVD